MRPNGEAVFEPLFVIRICNLRTVPGATLPNVKFWPGEYSTQPEPSGFSNSKRALGVLPVAPKTSSNLVPPLVDTLRKTAWFPARSGL